MKKKCYSLLRWPCLLQDVLNRRLLFQKQTGSSSTKKTITHHFFVSGIGQKKTVDAAKICGGAENVVKTGNPANIHLTDCSVYYFRHLYSAGSVCIAHNNCMSCPSIWATLSALLINILLGSFQLFLHNWSASLWGWNNPVQRCLPVGGRLHYPRRRRWWLHWLTELALLMCNRRR